MDEQKNDRQNVDEEPDYNPAENKHSGGMKGKFLWSLVFVLIAALTITAIVSQADFSFEEFLGFLKALDPFYLALAIVAMLGNIVFEALAIMTIIKSFGYRRSFAKGFVYSAGDIYFSAITPSASGGQPASAYFMLKDGIPGAVVTVSLVVNLIMYTFGILVIGILSFIVNPSVFLGFSLLSKIIIAAGSLMLCGVAVLFILVLFKSRMLSNAGHGCISFLTKIRIIRKPEPKHKKIDDAIAAYKSHVKKLSGKGPMLVRAFIYNFLQRASVITVTLLTFLASGGNPALSLDVWTSQCLVVLGSNPMPVPGAMGISDYLLIDAFGAIGVSDGAAMSLNLITRTISFYSCVLICGIAVVLRIVSYRFGKNKKDKM